MGWPYNINVTPSLEWTLDSPLHNYWKKWQCVSSYYHKVML